MLLRSDGLFLNLAKFVGVLRLMVITLIIINHIKSSGFVEVITNKNILRIENILIK